MKVLLISANTAKTPYPVYPLGMGMIAGSLVRNGYVVRQTDLGAYESDYKKVLDVVREFEPQVIGISIRNIDNTNSLHELSFLDSVKYLIGKIKESSCVPVVLGGSGFSIMPDKILQYTRGDYGVSGEGEVVFPLLLKRFKENSFPSERIFTAPGRLVGEEIQPALYDSQLMEYYLSFGKIGALQTKRGCIYQCAYCTYPFLEGKELRVREAKSVCDDIELLLNERGAEFIFFTDSLFNDREGKYLDVLLEMKRRKISVPWSAFFQPWGFTNENVALMKETGLIAVELGSDSATDKTLKGLRKRFRFQDIKSSNDLLVDNGVAVAHYFMFGGPGETIHTVREGIDNIRSLVSSVSFIFSGIRVFPGTELYERSLLESVISKDQDLLKPVYYFSPDVSKKEMEEALGEAFAGSRQWIYPPDAMEDHLQLIHKMGKPGMGWDLLVQSIQKRSKRDLKKGFGENAKA